MKRRARSRKSVRALSLLVTTSVSAVAAPPAPAETREEFEYSFLGRARAVSLAWSASRDTPAMTLQPFPRATAMGGGDFALATLRWPSLTLRTGFAGFIELESDGETNGVNSGPFPGGSGSILWRGAYAYYVAFAPPSFGHAVCSTCTLELTLQYRHESQHYTGSNHGGEGQDVSDQPYVGNSVIVDGALAERLSEWYFAERVLALFYVPNHSSYSAGAGIDLHARYLLFPKLHPFTSLYGEYRQGTELRGRRYPDVYRVRALLGVALPSELGDILVYGAGDMGHRYGVRGLSEEATLGVGVRLTVGSSPLP